jgi:hypothetical protein
VAWREEQEREAAAAGARERQLAPLRRVARALMERSIRVTRPQFGFQQTGDTALPWLTDDGVLHFPAMFFYPEATPYHDTIEDCSEHDVIADHLDQVCSEPVHVASAPANLWCHASIHILTTSWCAEPCLGDVCMSMLMYDALG